MTVTGTVSDVLRHKGSTVWSISPDASVYEAIEVMADRNIGALLVVNDDHLFGVVSERDYTSKVVFHGGASNATAVRDILSPMPISVTPDTGIAECLRLMTEGRIRHLPVLDGDRIVGLVSIGDLLSWTISAQETTIGHLREYISGFCPA